MRPASDRRKIGRTCFRFRHTRARTPRHELRRGHLASASARAEFLDGTNRTVERDPSHDLRVREVAPPTAHFPDAFVRLLPNFLEVQKEGALQRPSRVASREAGAARDVKGVEHFTIDIELELSDGAITRFGPAPSLRSPAAMEFRIPGAAVRPPHRRESANRRAPRRRREGATRATPSLRRECQPQSAHKG